MLRGKSYWILVMVLTLLFAATAVLPAYASLDEKLREQEELERNLKQERNNLSQQRNREAQLQQELNQLERRLNALRAELARLAGEIRITEQEIAETEAELAEAEAQLAAQEELLNSRLRAMHERGSVTYLEVLLTARTFGEFLTRLNNLKIIAENDLRLVDEIQAERDRIQLQKEELEVKKNSLEEMRRQTLANEAEVERTSVTRERVLSELQAQIAANLKAIADLERESQELEREIRRLVDASKGTGVHGKLHWPIASPAVISSGYGWRRNPFTGANSWHGGIDIAPYYGRANNIFAAERGTVIVSSYGWNGGYGNYIMIDHGSGTVTLYAHMSSLSVGVGANVSRGQTIGRAGTTGSSTGVHLHFEVREYNKPPVRYYPNGWPDHRYNPMAYF